MTRASRRVLGILALLAIAVIGLRLATNRASEEAGPSAVATATKAEFTTSSQPPASPSVLLKRAVPGSADAIGCGDHLWLHVYHPSRLEIESDCATVAGVIVDATGHRRSDGVRKEKDGDTHGWLKVDAAFEHLLNAGNAFDEDGNLVFEIVCYWKPTQADATSSCPADYTNSIRLPAVGTHVAITGTLVTDHNHGRWREIHPVSSIVVRYGP